MAERAHPDDPAFRGTVYEERLRERYAFCQPFVQGKDVLDVPCGTGWGSSMLSGYASLTGLDIDEGAIAFALEHYPHIRFVCGPMQKLPFDDDSFDVVICLEGLEHIYLSEARAFVREAHRVLRPDGTLIVTAPLLNAGRHSGNPYHMYEFTGDELRQLLETHFECDSFEIFAGGDGPEARFVGRRRSAPQPAAPAHSSAGLFERAYEWLLSLRRDSGFAFAPGHEQSLMATCWAVLSLEGMQRLADMPPAELEAIGRWIQEMQEPETGLFRDPLLQRFPVQSASHDEEYLLHQMTYFAIQALDALNMRPRHRLRFATRFNSPEAITDWLAGLDWSDAWLQSNRVMFVLAFLIYTAEVEGDNAAPQAYHTALDWLERTQDPRTGLWGTNVGASTLNGMAAAYHFLPFFEYVHRPLQMLNTLIDSTLSLQQADHLFGPTIGGGACEDLDAIDALLVASKYTRYRAGEVKRALLRAFWAIWNAQNADGGFGYAMGEPGATYRYSGWEALEIGLDAGDTWATWFRLLALATIQSAYPDDVPHLGAWQFRRWPALGYHRTSKSLTERERAVLPLWIRPLPQSAGKPVESPRVSVVIPCYNLGRYLHDALSSALRQTVQSVEVILVDDGSTDEYTLQLISQLDHPQVQVIRQQNMGLPVARNNGIRRARAPFICCLDADDRLRPEFFERALSLLENDPDLGFVSCHYQEFDGRHGTIDYTSCGLPEMLITNRAVVSSLFRRTAWEKVGGYCETLTGMHDWDLWLGILEAGYRAVIIPEVLFEYRVRDGSMYNTTRQPENYARLVSQIVDRHAALYRQWSAEVIAGYARELAQLANYAHGQALLAQQYRAEAEQRTVQLQKLQEHREYLNQQVHGLTIEVENWRSIAERRAEWSRELEAARDYHTNQAQRWQAVASEQALQIAQLQAQIDQLKTEYEAQSERLKTEYEAQSERLRAERDQLLHESWRERFIREIRSRKRASDRAT